MKKSLITICILSSLMLFSCLKNSKIPDAPPTAGVVSTYAGNGTAGLLNGPGATAEFNLPIDIVPDLQGNLFIAEQGSNVIRKLSFSGVVSTYAGDGKAGYKDGAAADAEFNNPEGLTIDNAGNLYVSDAQNNVIRKITPAGQVSTYAGSGTPGHTDGASLTAQFTHPAGLAIDKSRNIYVADYGNNLIRKISSSGTTVSTYAGNGTAGFANGAFNAASFNGPLGLAINPSGNLYVADLANNAIRLIANTGIVSTIAGDLHGPVRVALDVPGNLFVPCGDNIIRLITPDGTVSTYAGAGIPGFKDGAFLDAEFNSPSGLVADPAGNILIADYNNNRLRLLAP